MLFRKMSLSLGVVLVLTIFCLAAPVQAETVDITVHSFLRGKDVSFYWTETGTNRTVATGEFRLTVDGDAKYGYCIDLNEYLSPPISFTEDVTYASDLSGSYLEIFWIMQNYAPGLGNSQAGYDATELLTAVQIAIWEVRYENYGPPPSSGVSYDLTAGKWWLQGYVPATDIAPAQYGNNYQKSVDMAEIILTNLTGANITADTFGDFFGIYERGGVQDLAFGSTPEPASMLLFASALGAGGWIRRRMGKKTKGKAASA